MATDWSKATPEQIEARNARRRATYAASSEKREQEQKRKQEQYHNLSPEDRELLRLKKQESRALSKAALVNTGIPDENGILHWKRVKFTDENGEVHYFYDDESWNFVTRKERKIKAHKDRWLAYIKRLQDHWLAGDKYPGVYAQDKIKVTELFAKVLHIKGRRCKQCGCHNMWDFSWKITLARDVMAWQPFKESTFQRALRNPEEFDLYCIRCSWDISLWAFYWVFSPYSLRNNPEGPAKSIGGPRYDNWDRIFPVMYPAGWDAISGRIKRGIIKSLTCQIVGPGGYKIDTFLRKNQFHGWAKFQTHDFHHSTMQEVAALYMDNFPDLEYRMMGHESIEIDITYVRRRKACFMSEDLRRFILTTPMGPHRNKDGTWRNLEPNNGCRILEDYAKPALPKGNPVEPVHAG